MEGIMDIVGDSLTEPEWLEVQVPSAGDFRIWHLIFFGLSGVLSIVIMICCCFRFRIPRTKQDIEADYQRRIIAKKFRERLANIQNSEMDDMDLQKALDRVRQDYLSEAQKAVDTIQKAQKISPPNKLKI